MYKNLGNKMVIYEHNAFRELKKEENKNRSVPISDDILYISDFTLERFPNDGDSGDLYIATNKYNHNEKYILKHEYYDCACNEYIYSKIGNKMGIKIASVKLFILDNKEKRFKSDFVCGIKYLENCKHVDFKYIEKNKGIINNWKDFFRMFGLLTLFEEGDGMEVVKYNNEIYRLDTTDAFSISGHEIYLLAYDYNYNDINVREFAKKNILKRSERKLDGRMNSWESGRQYVVRDYGVEYLDYYMEAFKLLLNVTEKDIDEWINILTYFYPNVIGEYFKRYFINLKFDVEQFLIKFSDKDLLEV